MNKIDTIGIYSRKIINPGGAEKLLLEEYKYFKKRCKEVKIFTFELEEKSLFNQKCKIEVVSKNSDNLISYVFSLRKAFKKFKPDIVLSSQPCAILYSALLFLGIPYAIHIHSSIFWFPDNLIKYSYYYSRAQRRVRGLSPGHLEFNPPLRDFSFIECLKKNAGGFVDFKSVQKAKKIFVLTEKMKKELNLIYKLDSTVVTGAISEEWIKGERIAGAKDMLGLSGKKVLLSVNRLDPIKRIDLLIEVFHVLSKEDNDLILLIVGIGPEEDKLRGFAEQLGIADRVRFEGFVDEDRLKIYYSASDVFVATAWADFSLSVYEALAFGNKVVWSSEMDDRLIKNENVFVADPTLDSFVEATRKALKTKGNANIDLSDYSWGNYCNKIYDELCSIV